MQRYLNYHRYKLRDLEDRYFDTVLLITNSSYVISYLILLLIYCIYILFFSHYFFTIVYNLAIAAIPNKPFYIHTDIV